MIVRTANVAILHGIVGMVGDAGLLKAYSAPMPATGGGAIDTAVLLGTITLGTPMGTVSGTTLTFATSTPDISVDATDNIAWVRITDSVGTWVMDLDVTVDTADPLGAVTIPTTTAVQIGGILSLAASTLTVA